MKMPLSTLCTLLGQIEETETENRKDSHLRGISLHYYTKKMTYYLWLILITSYN